LQVAADPEHPNKHHGTLALRGRSYNFEETAGRKSRRAAACQSQIVLKLKINLFMYEIYRPIG
jgi:hypothetical protein